MENKLREHQLTAVDALSEIDAILTENNIAYFLLAGSTLGAVRHHGFIPWDDDIDIGIFLKDREKAYNLINKNLSKKYQFKSLDTDSNYPRFFGKILHNGRGCIDIFLLVKTSDNIFMSKSQWILRKILFKLYKSKISYINKNEINGFKNKLKLYITRFCSLFISKKTVLKLTFWNENRFENKPSVNNYINLYSAYSREKELIRSDWLASPKMVDFENKNFPTVGSTDEYLTKLYGDYMKLPPEHKRIVQHDELFK